MTVFLLFFFCFFFFFLCLSNLLVILYLIILIEESKKKKSGELNIKINAGTNNTFNDNISMYHRPHPSDTIIVSSYTLGNENYYVLSMIKKENNRVLVLHRTFMSAVVCSP